MGAESGWWFGVGLARDVPRGYELRIRLEGARSPSPHSHLNIHLDSTCLKFANTPFAHSRFRLLVECAGSSSARVAALCVLVCHRACVSREQERRISLFHRRVRRPEGPQVA